MFMLCLFGDLEWLSVIFTHETLILGHFHTDMCYLKWKKPVCASGLPMPANGSCDVKGAILVMIWVVQVSPRWSTE